MSFYDGIKKASKGIKKRIKSKAEESETYLAFKNKALSTSLSLAEDFVPLLKESKFYEKGVITPDEFVESGDHLVLKYPSWVWSSAQEESFEKSYLPRKKQYLVIRGVPSEKRVAEIAMEIVEMEDVKGYTTIFDVKKIEKDVKSVASSGSIVSDDSNESDESFNSVKADFSNDFTTDGIPEIVEDIV